MNIKRQRLIKQVLISSLVLSGLVVTTTAAASADSGAVVGNSVTAPLTRVRLKTI